MNLDLFIPEGLSNSISRRAAPSFVHHPLFYPRRPRLDDLRAPGDRGRDRSSEPRPLAFTESAESSLKKEALFGRSLFCPRPLAKRASASSSRSLSAGTPGSKKTSICFFRFCPIARTSSVSLDAVTARHWHGLSRVEPIHLPHSEPTHPPHQIAQHDPAFRGVEYRDFGHVFQGQSQPDVVDFCLQPVSVAGGRVKQRATSRFLRFTLLQALANPPACGRSDSSGHGLVPR
jgi:hypothetical protein